LVIVNDWLDEVEPMAIWIYGKDRNSVCFASLHYVRSRTPTPRQLRCPTLRVHFASPHPVSLRLPHTLCAFRTNRDASRSDPCRWELVVCYARSFYNSPRQSATAPHFVCISQDHTPSASHPPLCRGELTQAGATPLRWELVVCFAIFFEGS
jgi:hypothetical protein